MQTSYTLYSPATHYVVDTVLNAIEVLTHFIQKMLSVTPTYRQEARREGYNSNSDERSFRGSPPPCSSKHARQPFVPAPRVTHAPGERKPWRFRVRPPPLLISFFSQKCPSLLNSPQACRPATPSPENPASSKTALKCHFPCGLPGLPKSSGTPSAFHSRHCLLAFLHRPDSLAMCPLPLL